MVARSLLAAVLATSAANAACAAWTAPATLFDPLVASKVLATAKTANASPKYPSITSTSGVWSWSNPDGWTSGFFPSTLYQMQKRECMCPGSTKVNGATPDWLALGRTWAAALVPLHYHNNQGHDVGFLSWPFVDELALNPTNKSAAQNIIDFALELTSRYDPDVGATRSWNGPSQTSTTPATDFQVIIDNLMNLETLLQVYSLTGNKTFYDIAIRHADVTMKNHFRADGGSWHVVNYDSETGQVKEKYTVQGYSDSSTWSRGEAWAIHGYARMYQYTRQQRYLDFARKLATYFLSRTPASYMPWDFDAPMTPPLADSSAAMIAAAGLQLLATAEMSNWNTAEGTKWMDGAKKLISQTAASAWKPSWQSLLSNGTRDNHGTPRSNSTGLPYGDYFWVKNANYLVISKQVKCPSGASPVITGCGSDLNGLSF